MGFSTMLKASKIIAHSTKWQIKPRLSSTKSMWLFLLIPFRVAGSLMGL
jgi:hypothetical protein